MICSGALTALSWAGGWLWVSGGSHVKDLGVLMLLALTATAITWWIVPQVVAFVRHFWSFFARVTLSIAYLLLFIWLYYLKT